MKNSIPWLFILVGMCMGVAIFISQTWLQKKPEPVPEIVRPVVEETNRFDVKPINAGMLDGKPTLYLVTDRRRGVEILYFYQGNAAAAVKLGEAEQ